MNYEWSDRDREIRESVKTWLTQDCSNDLSGLSVSDTAGIRDTVTRLQQEILGRGFRNGDGAWSWYAFDVELARASSALFLSVQATRGLEGLLNTFGVKPTQIPAIGAVAFSDPAGDGGRTTLRSDGDGFRLNGSKHLVTNAPIADGFGVFADLEGQEAFCLVFPGMEGIEVGPRVEMMGLDGLALGGLSFEDVLVEPSNLFGPFETGEAGRWYALRNDLSLADACNGLMYRTLRAATKHTGEQKRHGKPVNAHQEVRFQLAEMFTLLQTAGLLNRRARWMLESGHHDAGTVIGCARVFGAENAERVASSAMQVTAGSGYVKGSAMEQAFRDAKGLALAGTSVELSRMAIADELLERY